MALNHWSTFDQVQFWSFTQKPFEEVLCDFQAGVNNP